MKNKKIITFILMHFGFLIYSLYSLLGKFASRFDFLSFNFCLVYIGLVFILFVYAILWQQVLKVFELSIATANKAATIIWGLIWSKVFFGEEITLKKIIAVLLIIAGIMVLSSCELHKEDNNA